MAEPVRVQQEFADAFYWSHGPCCAGCDWWASNNSSVGECTRSAPVMSGDRIAMLGMERASIDPGAGHIMTTRDHRCGEFRDTFDWASLPSAYLRRIGAPTTGTTGAAGGEVKGA